MGLHVADRARVHAGLGDRLGDEVGLGVGVRDGVAVGLAAVVDGAAFDDGVDLIARLDRLGERFEQDGADALARHVAIATFAKALAQAIACGELALREYQVLVRVHGDVHAPGHGHFTVPAQQALAGEVDGRERRGAHGVDGQARAVEVTEVGDAVGDRGDIAA